jgi:hypothetical protein
MVRRAALLLGPALAACGGAASPMPAVPVVEAQAPPAGEPGCVEDAPYQPQPAYSGRSPDLPALPALPSWPVKVGDAYTVRGATHHLRSRFHHDDVEGKTISIVGYVVRTNYDAAPVCAVHRTGVGDPSSCRAPVPMFAIADEKGETGTAIDVMGWASNFAQIFTLIDAIDKAPKGREAKVRLRDELWGDELPNPLPNVGAKVKVTGKYAITFTRATGGVASNPRYGILTAGRIEYLEPPAKRAALPGMRLKKR